MSKIIGISKSLKIEIVGRDNFLFPKIKKEPTKFKKNEINLNFFLKCIECIKHLCEF